MQEMYHSQRSARCHKENMMPVPDDLTVHPEYLCGCKTEDFTAGFRQLHDTVGWIYDDMFENPADWGLPPFEIEKYRSASGEANGSDFSARITPENCVFFEAFHDRMTQLGYTYQLDVEGIYSDWWKLEYYENDKRSRHFFAYQDGVLLRLKLNHVGTYTGFIETCLRTEDLDIYFRLLELERSAQRKKRKL